MEPNHGSLLYEGKAKRIYGMNEPGKVMVEFKNDATAFNAKKKSEIEGKGRLNCLLSAYFFELLESEGIQTHYKGLISDNWMVAQHVEVIPIEVVLRNIATGSLCRETPVKQGTKLKPPLLDLYFKDDALGDPLLTESRLELLDLISLDQRNDLEKIARRVNYVLGDFMHKLDLLLVDLKLELGVNHKGQLLVADEISPDTCRIWDLRVDDPKDRILDKDRFRQDLGGVVESYGEVFKRVQEVSSEPHHYK